MSLLCILPFSIERIGTMTHEKLCGTSGCTGTGRRDCIRPITCECGWKGRRKDASHEYGSIGGFGEDDAEVEPVDLCPKCQGEI
jgi:hypothetical protein|tara:strand:- start:78 stop:329 length:252 start_codon:yes stop_codon:yes gene_type:complete